MNSTEHAQKILEMEKSLRYISHIVKQRGREILNNYPITPPQFIALQWLRELGDLTIGELSKKMYLAFSTTTDLVDRMEKNELIVRIRDPKDRRVVRIHLSDILLSHTTDEFDCLHESMAQLHKVMVEHEQQN